MLSRANRNALINSTFKSFKVFLKLACTNVQTNIHTEKLKKSGYHCFGFYCVYKAPFPSHHYRFFLYISSRYSHRQVMILLPCTYDCSHIFILFFYLFQVCCLDAMYRWRSQFNSLVSLKVNK